MTSLLLTSRVAGSVSDSMSVGQRANPDNTDFDRDGVPDSVDVDDDNDAIPDVLERSSDTDGDGQPDCLDLDSDNDGIPDLFEAIVNRELTGLLDSDANGAVDREVFLGANGMADLIERTPDSFEIVYVVANSDQDSVADFIDLDSDNDGLPDILESSREDLDRDGRVDGFVDLDLDGLSDLQTIGALALLDSDRDGLFDFRDVDSDQDGLSDLLETAGISEDIDNNGREDNFFDSDADGVDDQRSQNPLQFIDTDGDSVPNHLDLDSDGDGAFDLVESGGTDLDNNGRLDDTNSLPLENAGDSPVQSAEESAGQEIQPGSSVLTVGLDGNAHGCSLGKSSGGDAAENDVDMLFGVLVLLSIFNLFKKVARVMLASLIPLSLVACSNTGFVPYAGLGVGASQLELDTGESVLELTETQDVSTTLTVGVDLLPRVALESQFSDLGAAQLSNEDEVGYQTFSVTGLLSALPERRGFNLFARAGAGLLRNSEPSDSAVSIETRNSAHLVTGLGVEYLFNNGVVMRLEAVGHDADAQHADISVLYRFGHSPARDLNPPIFPVRTEDPIPETPIVVAENTVQQAPVNAESTRDRDPISRAPAISVQPARRAPTATTQPLPDIRPVPQTVPQTRPDLTSQTQPRPAVTQPTRPAPTRPEVSQSATTRPAVTQSPRAVPVRPVVREPDVAVESVAVPQREQPEPGIRKQTTVIEPRIVEPGPTAPPVNIESVETPDVAIPTVATSGSAALLRESGEVSVESAAPESAAQGSSATAAATLSEDSDADGVVDVIDECQRTPASLPVGDSGCLRYRGTVNGIDFESAGDVLTSASLSVLNNVAKDLDRYPLLSLNVQVKSEDDSSSSVLLARKRTLSVIRYLVGAGVAGSRLKPTAPNVANAGNDADPFVALRTIVN